jgi:integrase
MPEAPPDVPLDKEVRAELGRILRKARKLSSVPLRVFDAAGIPIFKGVPDKNEVIRAFKRARQRAGIFPGDFHSLRLSFARNCACAGVPISFAARPFDREEDLSLVREIYEEHLILEKPPKRG